MAASELSILGVARLREIYEAVQDIRQIPTDLLFRTRTNKVAATDGDIIGRFFGQLHIADIVADDQRASTYQAGRVRLETNLIPNIKLGRSLTQEDFKRLEFIAANNRPNVESTSYEDYFVNEANLLLSGIELREETMLVGMMIDSFAYNRGGVILNLNWGMPAELKVTTAFAWTDTVNATPIADILNLKLIGSAKYGKAWNRVTMSTSAFRNITRTNEFASQIRNFFINAGQPVPSIPYQNINALKLLVGTILGIEVVVYDKRYPTHPTDGTSPIYVPILPLQKVVLDDANDDGDNTKKDFANGVVTESIVGSIGNNNLLGKFGAQYGPFTYVTVPSDLNPPTATFWAVERGMPRKKDIALNGVLDVGTTSDFITAGIAF